MRRKICWLVLAMLAGIFARGSFNPAYLVLALFACLLAMPIKRRRIFPLILACAFILSGFYATFFEQMKTEKSAPFLNGEFSMTARVVTAPEAGEENQKAVVRVRQAGGQKADFDLILSAPNGQSFAYGDIIAFTATVKTPQTARNAGEFDYNLYLKTKTVFVRAYADTVTVVGHESVWFHPMDLANELRGKITAALNAQFSGTNLAMAKAILVGDKSGMTDDFTDAVSKTGLSHVFAVSGLHLGIILSLVLFVMLPVFRRERLVRLLCIPVILLFMLICGLSPSVQRAGIMLILFCLSSLFFRDGDSLAALAAAAGVMVLANPLVVYSTGAQLSFAASLGIVLFEKHITPRLGFIKIKYLRDLFSVSLSAQIFVIPITAMSFHQFVFLGLLANIIAVPLLPVVIAGGFLSVLCFYTLAFLAPVFVFVTNAVLSILTYTIHLFAAIPASSFAVYWFGGAAAVSYLLLVWFLYLKCVKVKSRAALLLPALSGAIIITWFTMGYLDSLNFHLYSINIGQGDCTLITKGRTAIMIDGGETTLAPSDYAAESIDLFLKTHGISKLDAVFISHYDSDHYNGILPLIKENKTRRLFLPQGISSPGNSPLGSSPLGGPPLDTGGYTGETYYVSAGSEAGFGELHFEVLLPDDKSLAAGEPNAQSVVMRLSYGEFSVLFTGDIGFSEEKRLLELYPDLHCDILKVAHHGSKYSTGEDFLTAVQPKVALISSGAFSRYHPSERVVHLLNDYQVFTCITEYDGTSRVTLKPGEDILIENSREN